MDILTLVKANIRHQKSSFIGIMIIMIIVSMALAAVLTININSRQRDSKALKEDGFGDMFVMLRDEQMSEEKLEELLNSIEQSKYVDQLESVQSAYGRISDLNGNEGSDTVILEPDQQDCFSFQVFNETETGFQEKISLKQGEIGVPISYQSLYDCKLGDTLYLKTSEASKGYKIKYFFEDPFVGSAMMGIKVILLNPSDLTELRQLSQTDEYLKLGHILNIFQAKDSKLNYLEFEKAINLDTGVEGYARSALGIEAAQNYMLLTNIFCGILVSFIILLLIVAVIVMSHSINSSIELEYVNLGILKAVGFTQKKLGLVLIFQYLLATIMGALIGLPLALPIISIMNKMTMPVTCLLISNQLAIFPCVATMLGIMLFLLIIICLKLRRLSAITPIKAISGGRDNIYFSSRMELPIHKKGMNFWMALRQLTSNGKQYISAGIITALLIFFLVMISNMGTWVGKDGGGLIKMFSCTDSDLEIDYGETDLQGEVEQIIQSSSDILSSYESSSSYLLMDGFKIYTYMISDSKQFNTILEGRTCQYDNEILITKSVAKDLKLDIGETVTITNGENKGEYMISGIFQSGNDMGTNIAMNNVGFEKLTDNFHSYQEYILEDKQVVSTLVEQLNNQFGDDITVAKAADAFGALDPVVTAVNGVSMLVYLLSVIFVIIVIFLICTKIFGKEHKDYGIYKAVGYTSRRLRLQFALRFVIVSVISSLVGIIMSLALADFCMGFLLSNLGISQFKAEFTLGSLLFPMLFMAVVFFLFSYLLSGKIRRVTPRVLISE